MTSTASSSTNVNQLSVTIKTVSTTGPASGGIQVEKRGDGTSDEATITLPDGRNFKITDTEIALDGKRIAKLEASNRKLDITVEDGALTIELDGKALEFDVQAAAQGGSSS